MICMYGYIYKTTNLKNNTIYIGQRKGEFDSEYFGSGVALNYAIKKYGIENFKVEVIEYCKTFKIINNKEIYYIADFKKKGFVMYNISLGGQGGANWDDPEYRAKVLKAREGTYCFGKKNGMYGKTSWKSGQTHSPETKEKMRLSAIKRFKDPIQKEFIKNLNIGRKKTKKWIKNHKKKMKALFQKDPGRYAKHRYHTPFGIFNSIKEIQQVWNLTRDVLYNCFMKPNYKITMQSLQRSKMLCYEDVGKTYKELGWYYLPLLIGGK